MSENHLVRSIASPITPGVPDEEHRPHGHGPEQASPGKRAPVAEAPRTRVGAVWAGIIVSAVVLIVLLAFILQNSNPVEIYFLTWVISLPVGIALLGAAVAGIFIVAIPGASRMSQLRRAGRRTS
jgi:uncharacterized integral membrane protein